MTMPCYINTTLSEYTMIAPCYINTTLSEYTMTMPWPAMFQPSVPLHVPHSCPCCCRASSLTLGMILKFNCFLSSGLQHNSKNIIQFMDLNILPNVHMMQNTLGYITHLNIIFKHTCTTYKQYFSLLLFQYWFDNVCVCVCVCVCNLSM